MKTNEKRKIVWHLLMVMIVFLSFILCLSQIADETALARPFVTTGKIAFALVNWIADNRPSNIYVIDADGTNLKKLTQTDRDSGATWSPDGKQIAFTSSRNQPGVRQIYVMNADGKNQRPLTKDGANTMSDWSLDGQTVVFNSYRDGNFEIYLMDPDGNNQRRLTQHPAADLSPAFSPDGRKIAFMSDRDSPPGRLQDYHLYVMNSDGTGVIRLIPEPVYPGKPAWSPDGGFIIFTGALGRTLSDVYRVNADGTGLINLTNHPGSEIAPTWSPDGTKIAFSAWEGEKSKGIYLMNPDGTGIIKISSKHGNHLDWYGPRNLAVIPYQKEIMTWGWLKGMFSK